MSLFDTILGERVFITGGTGSLGSTLTRYILDNSEKTVVVCYSRDPHKQDELEHSVKAKNRLRLVVGDIRDKDRLRWSMRGSTTTINCAALKHVGVGEYNVVEFIETNVNGTMNVAEVAISLGVRKVLAISTDKAPSAFNAYGKTKALAESFIIRSNVYGHGDTKLSVIRYGNVFDSRGNVMEVWRDRISRGLPLVVREPEPSRFICRLSWGVQWIMSVLEQMRGGEIFVPANLKTISMWDLATQFSPRDYWQIEPLGSGEKQHEVLLSEGELRDTVKVGDFWVVNPADPQWQYQKWTGEPVDKKAICSETAERMKMSEFMETFGV